MHTYARVQTNELNEEEKKNSHIFRFSVKINRNKKKLCMCPTSHPAEI